MAPNAAAAKATKPSTDLYGTCMSMLFPQPTGDA
jgi:hypothetical protein